ncbi:MAG: hypothetical protein JWP97_3769 [Labilithrix sp.]|nr:hypothetical protein [Labilithrix sp.]
MKSWMFRAVAAAMMLSTAHAVACPLSGWSPPGRPVQNPVETAQLRSNELVEEAKRVELRAATLDRRAADHDREAGVLEVRARLLARQAQRTTGAEREELRRSADEVAGRAASRRAEARQERDEVAGLRAQGLALRERAVQLVREALGGGTTRPLPRGAVASTEVMF